MEAYTTRMEPSNCPRIEGRMEAEELRTLPFLESAESRQYDHDFRILSKADDIDTFLARIPIST